MRPSGQVAGVLGSNQTSWGLSAARTLAVAKKHMHTIVKVHLYPPAHAMGIPVYSTSTGLDLQSYPRSIL